MKKDEILTTIAAIILLFTALIDWNIYSWLILAGVVIIIFAWYLRNTESNTLVQST
jgi:hypothetical protein